MLSPILNKFAPTIKTLYPRGKSKGNVLISYLPYPPFGKIQVLMYSGHTNVWESFKIAETWRAEGFAVDIIDHANAAFIPLKDYTVFVDIKSNMERLTPLLPKKCIKVLHITGAHWSYQNKAEKDRIDELNKRKGILLAPRRLQDPNRAIETADCATILGNKFTQETYKFSNKKLYPIPISTNIQYQWFGSKKYDNCHKNYLWFGNGGLVHKGLDLVLDSFVQLPDYQLSVCGPITNEKDFENLYYDELYNTPNIRTYDWVDVRSRLFRNILYNSIGLVYPSCSEGGGGSVITCMHAGIIPIISYESSVNVGDFGIILKKNSIECIIESIQELSSISGKEFELRSRRTWEFARMNHTRKSFSDAYRKFVKSCTIKGEI
jgi:hypothetical protein